MPEEVRYSRTYPGIIYINHFSLPNDFCFTAVCAFPYILAFTTDSIEIRLVVNGNLVHTAVVPELQLVASRVRHMKIMFEYFCHMLGSNSCKKLPQLKIKQTKPETCATWSMVTVHLCALNLCQVQREQNWSHCSLLLKVMQIWNAWLLMGQMLSSRLQVLPTLAVG